MTSAASESAALDEGTGVEGAGDGRSTRWDDHNADRRERIIDAAIELVRQAGGNVAVSDISARAGVPRSVIYRIFRDRDDLDEQVRTEVLTRLMRVLSPALEPQGTIRGMIDTAATTYVDWVSQNPLLHQFLGTGPAKRRMAGSRVVTGTRTAIARQIQALLEAAALKAHADTAISEPLAFGLVGLVDGAVNRWVTHTDTGLSARALSAFLADSIWTMLAAHGQPLGITLTPGTRASDVF